MKAKLLLLLAMAIGITAVNAQTKTPVINHKQKVQHERIKQGVKTGELTRHETKTLAKQQRAIRHEKRESKKDGIVSRGERRNIRHDQRKTSRDIFRKKHNDRTAR